MATAVSLSSPKPRDPGAPWSLAEAGRFLGLSAKTLERRVKAGELKTIKFGRLVRIPDDVVRQLATSGF